MRIQQQLLGSFALIQTLLLIMALLEFLRNQQTGEPEISGLRRIDRLADC